MDTEDLFPPFPFSFVLVGAGRVSVAVSRLLVDAGHSLQGVTSRTPTSAERASAFLDAASFTFDNGLPPGDVVLLGVGDAAIEEVAETLRELGVEGRVVWHLSGSSGLAPLQRVIESGAYGCALHPVQACPDVATAVARLPGSAWGITTSEEVADWARRTISESLAGTPVAVAERQRPLWHAAAVMVSNGVAALMATGEAVLRNAGIDMPERVLGPLATGTVLNAVEGGGGGATLTGPVVRGEADTVSTHLHALRSSHPDLANSYGLIARLILEQAVRAERLDPEAAAPIARLIEESR